MKVKKTIKYLFYFYLIIIFNKSYSIELDDVKIYTDNDPPYVVIENNIITGGSTVDKMLKVLKKLNLPISKIEALPWARAYNEAKSKANTMIFPIAKTKERLKYLDFTFKIIDSKVYFYKLRTRKDIKLKSFEDAKKYSICVVLDDYRHEYLVGENFKRLDPTTDSTRNVKKFISGRCDLIPSTEIGIESKLKSLGEKNSLVLKILELNKLDSALYAAFNKETPVKTIEKFKLAAKEE